MPGRSERIAPFALATLVLLLFLPPAGLRDWWYPDEPDVALPAIEMATRGDWVIPTHNGVPWLDYPPLAYWGARAAGTLAGGITPSATRVPMVLFAALFVAATVWLGRQLGQVQWGLLGGTVLIATPTLWFHASNLQADLGYAAFIALGLAVYHRGELASGIGWRILAFACFGIAILGKGPLGVLLPGLILSLWHAWNREWRRLPLLAPLALVSLAVALPWYLLLCDRLGTEVVWSEIVQQNLDRFGAAKRGHGGKGMLYYLTRLPADLGVWTAFIIPALWQGFRTRRDDRSWRLLAVWLLAPLVFFTLASTKRNVYLLPVFPALALLVADWLARGGVTWEVRFRVWSGRAFAVVLLLVGVFLIVTGMAWGWLPTSGRFPTETWTSLRPAALATGLWLTVAGGWTLRDALAGTLRTWWSLAASTTLAYVLIMWLVLPVLDQVLSYRPAARWLAERVPAGGRVGFFSPGRELSKRAAWLCHLDGRRLHFLGTPDDVQAWLVSDPTRLVLSSPAHVAAIQQVRVIHSWTISSHEWLVLATAR
jgi:4-amino-4-deoxy-L-arabinose transferase-like glycosyltransferase